MKKLIASSTKKNIEKARRRLESIELECFSHGVDRGVKKGTEALELGYRYLGEFKAQHALQVANSLLEKVDDIVDVYLLKARALLELEAIGELSKFVGSLAEAAPNNIGVLMVSARYHYLTGDIDNSLKYLRKANEIEASSVGTLLQIESCYRYTNQLENAEKVLQRCLKITQRRRWDHPEVFKQFTATLFRLSQYTELDESQMDDLNRVYEQAEDLAIKNQSAYCLAMQYGKRKDLQNEVLHLRHANTAESRLLGVHGVVDSLASAYEKEFDQQVQIFESDRLASLKCLESSHQPIFILGLPRSGTTLLEQILGSHSEVGQVGESKAFTYALQQMLSNNSHKMLGQDYPKILENVHLDAFRKMTSDYERHQQVLSSHLTYVDKELANFKYVGLMALLFPKARFVHMDRAPMDVFLSCFRNSIPGVPESSDLQAIAEYYVFMKRLIGLWRRVIGERLIIVNYQDLVNDPEAVVKPLAGSLSLEYEEEMLSFYKRKNVVRSLSVDQVRNKIYSSSVEKWREYEEVLTPAKIVLEKYGLDTSGVAYL